MGDPTITFTSPPLGYGYQMGSLAYVRSVSHNIIGPLGASTYYYWVVAIYPSGTVPPPTPITVRNAPNILSPTNNIMINWVTPNNQVTGYSVLRTTSPVFPGNSNTAVIINTTANTVTDTGSALVAFTLTPVPLGRGVIYIDGSGATPILVSTLGIKASSITTSGNFTASSITFGDSTTQTTAFTISQIYNWTQNVQANGFQLLGLPGLTLPGLNVTNTPNVTAKIQCPAPGLAQLELTSAGDWFIQANNTAFQIAENVSNALRITIPRNNPTRIGLTTGAAFAPAHLLDLNTDDAGKPTTSTWTITSDIRTKRNTRRLEGGLSVIERLEPIESEYNGLADTPNGHRVVSFDPEDLAKVIPTAVSRVRRKLKLEDDKESDVAHINVHEVIFHLVLAVQQLASHKSKKG